MRAKPIILALALGISMPATAGELTTDIDELPSTAFPFLTGIRDSTGVANTGSAILRWETGSWGSCSAQRKSCGTSQGTQSRTVVCKAYHLDGVTVSTRDNSLCLTVASTIGSLPATSQYCSRNWGACPPPPPPSPPASSSGGGGCSYRADVCAVYDTKLKRPPDPEGAAYWQAQLDQVERGTMTKKQFDSNFYHGTRGDDCTTIGKTDGLCA